MPASDITFGGSPPLDGRANARSTVVRRDAASARARPFARTRLKNGTRVRLRLIGPADRANLLAGFQRLSPQSRYWRFFSPMPKLPEKTLQLLLQTDGWDHLAVGAEKDGRAGRADRAIVGVARYFRVNDQPDTAEVAVAVVDELQGLGLGRVLLLALVDAARERKIEKFRAQVLPGNERMRSLLREAGVHGVSAPGQGYVAYEFPLPKAERYEVEGESFYRAFKMVAERLGAATEVLSAAMWGALGFADDSASEVEPSSGSGPKE